MYESLILSIKTVEVSWNSNTGENMSFDEFLGLFEKPEGVEKMVGELRNTGHLIAMKICCHYKQCFILLLYNCITMGLITNQTRSAERKISTGEFPN